MASQAAISVLNGQDARTVLAASSTKPGHAYVRNHLRRFLGEKSIVALSGKEWKLYRNAVHKSFTPAALEQSQQAMNAVGKTLSDSLLKAIEESPNKCLKRTVHPLCKMATMDVFGSAVLGVDFHSCSRLKLPAVAAAFEYLGEEFERRLKSPFDLTTSFYSIPTSKNGDYAQHRNLVRNYVQKQVDLAQQRIENETRQDLLINIVKAAQQEKETVDAGAVCDTALTLLFAGYDTTSIALTYSTYLLAKNPGVQTTCLEEINSIWKEDDSELSGPDQLPYTKAVVMESLRLFAPVTTISRVLEKDLTLRGHHIPKDTPVYLPVWLINRNEMNFESPLEMRPDRWVRQTQTGSWEERPSDDMESSDIAPGNRSAFVSFGAGARNCVGKNFAMREAVSLLAMLMRKIEFQLVEENYQVTPKLKLLQEPHDGLPMVLKRRV